jgi:TonB family protein
LLLAGCATAPAALPTNSGDAPEVVGFKKEFPDFYESLRQKMTQQFHAEELAKRAELGSGRWRVVVRIDVDMMGDSHGCKLLRSSGFNGVDEEAMAACRRLKEHLFPPESAVEADVLAHCPVQLVLER